MPARLAWPVLRRFVRIPEPGRAPDCATGRRTGGCCCRSTATTISVRDVGRCRHPVFLDSRAGCARPAASTSVLGGVAVPLSKHLRRPLTGRSRISPDGDASPTFATGPGPRPGASAVAAAGRRRGAQGHDVRHLHRGAPRARAGFRARHRPPRRGRDDHHGRRHAIDPEPAAAPRARRRRHRGRRGADADDRGRRRDRRHAARRSRNPASAWPSAPARRSPTSAPSRRCRRTLLAAQSIAYSSSVSGRYLTTELFQRLGIAEQMAAKSRRIEGERVGHRGGARRGRARLPADVRAAAGAGHRLRRAAAGRACSA